jgi:tripartite-type tricarboxylate transporter receptor subunit TctC
VQVALDPISSSIGYIRAGKLRALAVTAAARADVLPEIPSVNEFIPGYEAMDWSGVGVPKGTSDAIVAKLNAEINAALVDPKVVARLADLGSTPVPISSADFGKFIVEETEKWGKVVKFAGIKAE